MRAGKIGPHQHSGSRKEEVKVAGFKVGEVDVPFFYVAGGGGSHADLDMTPTFTVRKKECPDDCSRPGN